jgi:hypothetical protein
MLIILLVEKVIAIKLKGSTDFSDSLENCYQQIVSNVRSPVSVTKNINQTGFTLRSVVQTEMDWTSPFWWENKTSWFGRASFVWNDCHIDCCHDETRAWNNLHRGEYTKTTNNKPQIARPFP